MKKILETIALWLGAIFISLSMMATASIGLHPAFDSVYDYYDFVCEMEDVAGTWSDAAEGMAEALSKEDEEEAQSVMKMTTQITTEN